jgi:probable HAF family extracellular repeat protein
MTDITPAASYAYATAINDSGVVVGAASGPSLYWQAFGPLPPHSDDFWTNTSAAYGISNINQVVGAFGATSLSHAFLYANGVVTDLGTLGGSKSEALGVNDSGVAVGDSQFAANNTNTHAFVYMTGTMYDLNNLIPANSGWVLTNATGINDVGEIVGYGTNPSGQADSFLLTPTPEPGSLALLAISAIVLIRRR